MDLRQQLQSETVKDVGFRDVVAVPVDAAVREAVAVMQQHQVGCCCVVEEGRLVGIFTERNLVTRVLGQPRGLDLPISECMTRKPVTSRTSDPLRAVLAAMHQGGFRHIPLIDADHRPVGTVSVKRAVRFLREKLPEVVYNASEPGSFPVRAEGG